MGKRKKHSQNQEVDSTKAIEVCIEPKHFFQQAIRKCIDQKKLSIDTHTEFYLVDLLSRFMFSSNLFAETEDGGKKEETLAALFVKAMNASNLKIKLQELRRLGDISLYTAGFFSDRLSKKVVDLNYYVTMGKSAYSSLAQTGFEAFVPRVFVELSHHFTQFIDVLNQISLSTGHLDPKNLIRLYESWLQTRSENAAKCLKEAGIIPNQLLKKTSTQ